MTDTGGKLEFDSHLVGMWWELHSQFEATVTAAVQTTPRGWAGAGMIVLGMLLLVSVWRVAVSPRPARST